MTAVPWTGAKLYVDGKEFSTSAPLQFDDNDVALDMADERGMDVSLLRMLLRLYRDGKCILNIDRKVKNSVAAGFCKWAELTRNGEDGYVLDVRIVDLEEVHA